jgi:AcrR family transcriptional regulator
MADGTKRMLAKAYLELLENGGFKIITVKDVVENAGVSRMTFYYHFKDIYDLVDWIYRDYLDTKMCEMVHASDAWRYLAGTIIKMIDENELGIQDNYQHLDRAILDKMLTQLLYDLVARCFDADPDCAKFDQADRGFLIQLMTYCLSGMISSWLDHDFDFDPADYIDRFDRLIKQQIL